MRIGAFLGGLVVVFALAAGIGSLVEPADTRSRSGHEAMRSDHEAMSGEGGHQQMEAAPAGLAIAEGGYSLRLAPAFLARDESRELRFSVADADGEAVTDFDELHERRMHLILVRRDGTGFRHLHPEMDRAGTWTVPVKLAAPGAYRAFADFSVGGEQHTLATDLFVSGGSFQARPFPPPRRVDSSGGYEVSLDSGALVAGQPSSLSFAVARDGAEVADLDPYLGAKGHLVALREGDLAFLHVHPEEDTGEEVAFSATFPSAGRYRLYLQFKHEGAVRTAQFTVAVRR